MTHNVAVNTQYAKNIAAFLVKFVPIALFTDTELTTTSIKHLKKVESFHIVGLIDNFLSTFAGTTDLRYDFGNHIEGRREELTNIK